MPSQGVTRADSLPSLAALAPRVFAQSAMRRAPTRGRGAMATGSTPERASLWSRVRQRREGPPLVPATRARQPLPQPPPPCAIRASARPVAAGASGSPPEADSKRTGRPPYFILVRRPQSHRHQACIQTESCPSIRARFLRRCTPCASCGRLARKVFPMLGSCHPPSLSSSPLRYLGWHLGRLSCPEQELVPLQALGQLRRGQLRKAKGSKADRQAEPGKGGKRRAWPRVGTAQAKRQEPRA